MKWSRIVGSHSWDVPDGEEIITQTATMLHRNKPIYYRFEAMMYWAMAPVMIAAVVNTVNKSRMFVHPV